MGMHSTNTHLLATAVAPRNRNARGPTTSFPLKLHQMLDKAEECGYQDIISWLPGGRSFKIHDPEGMVSILCTHFNQSKYKSFLRQIQNYGFHRVTRGPKKGICTRELFVQFDPLLCLQMRRVSKMGNGRTSPTSTTSLSSMVFQAKCLEALTSTSPIPSTDDNASSGFQSTSESEDECEPVPFDPVDITESVTAFEDDILSSKILNAFSQLPQPQVEHKDSPARDDDSWLLKLLNHEEMWMMAPNMSSGAETDVNIENMFEPNHIFG